MKAGWASRALGDVLDVASGLIDPNDEPYAGWPHVGGDNIESHTGILRDLKKSGELGFISGKYAFGKDDVLYSKIRPRLNKVAVPDFDGTCSADIYPLRPRNGSITRSFLAYLLRSDDFLSYTRRFSTRTNIPKLNRKALLAYSFPLPPLKEQKRIAAILDAADELRAKRRESIDQLDTLLQSVFLDMFGDPVTNPRGWERVRMQQLTQKVTKGTTPTTLGMEYVDEGIPFVRVQNLVDGRVDFSREALFIDRETHAALGRSQIHHGDVLISIAGTIGRAAVVRSTSALNCNQAVAIVRPQEEVDPDFLLHWLATEDAQRQMRGKRVTATISNLSLTQIKALEVPAVPLELQRRFESTAKSVEHFRAQLYSHLEELDTLFASLQSRAFRGEL